MALEFALRTVGEKKGVLLRHKGTKNFKHDALPCPCFSSTAQFFQSGHQLASDWMDKTSAIQIISAIPEITKIDCALSHLWNMDINE